MSRIVILLVSCLCAIHLYAQTVTYKSKRDSLITYRNTTDTNYIRKYPNRLILTLYQSYRQYDIRFTQNLLEDTLGLSAPRLIADANVVTGLTVDFDKITFSFGLKSTPPTDAQIAQKGKTTYRTFSLSLSAYRFRFEGTFRRYKGFYDMAPARFDTLNNKYYQRPDLDVMSFRLRTIYIFNKRKFSYNAAYFNTHRQIKSAGTWLAVGNFYNYKVASDSAIIPFNARPFYGNWNNMNQYGVFGISAGVGASYTLVLFKRLYANFTLIGGPDFQHRTMVSEEDALTKIYWKTGYAGDTRIALGLNSKNFFMSLTYRQEYNSYQLTNFRIEPRFISVDFNVGYRFPFKERRWVTKLKSNKWYQLL